MFLHRRVTIALMLAFAALMIGVVATQSLRLSTEGFVDWPLPSHTADRLFDIGIVDANSDGFLDIYTSNHHFRQALLISDGHGGYRDVLSEWGLDQSSEFPNAELSFTPPVVDEPGFYVFWDGTQLVLRAHKIASTGEVHGSLRVNDPVEIIKQEGFVVRKKEQTSQFDQTVIEFSSGRNGELRLRPGGQGLPIEFAFDDIFPLSQLFVGRGKVAPKASTFSLAMRDRHAMAWADYNADGVLDVFINRGALGGTLRGHGENIKEHIADELWLSRRLGEFAEVSASVGIAKRGCSGRQARWVDFDNDGLLDLFVNCYDRGNVSGSYAKQLYRQSANGTLVDVAERVGFALPHQQIASSAWFDVDGDGDVDVLAFQDEGLFLYRQTDGRFVQEPVLPRALGAAERIGHTSGDKWFYDGKLTIADYDADGDLDVFSASKRGNAFLVNVNGRLSGIPVGSIGLPEESSTANWVDYDNDGLPDLYLMPQGLFKQSSDHHFVRTGRLAFDEKQYDAAIVNWADLDNDGRLDALMALHESPGFTHWWELSKKHKPTIRWELVAFRNVGPPNHWLQLSLVGPAGNRQAIGARVAVRTSDGEQTQEVGGTEGSFFSQGHYRLYFGLNQHAKVEALTIRWPDGYSEELKDVAADRLLVVRREKN